MPGKSRHRKGKYSFQAAKRGETGQSAPSSLQTAAVPAAEPASSQVKPSPSQSSTSLATESVVVNHPFISAELRTIGILAVLMLVILVGLALAFA
ncbi:MAG: hypothetical protein V3S02_06010 [Dehalococcoidales bacterium]